MLGVGVHLPLPSSLGAQPGQELDEASPPQPHLGIPRWMWRGSRRGPQEELARVGAASGACQSGPV